MRSARLIRLAAALTRRSRAIRPAPFVRFWRPARTLHTSRFLRQQQPPVTPENHHDEQKKAGFHKSVPGGSLIGFSGGKVTVVITNGLDLKSAQRYMAIFTFLEDAFMAECEDYRLTGEFKTDLAQKIVLAFSQRYPDLEPISVDDVTDVFWLYHSLAQENMYLDDINFSDPAVTEIEEKCCKVYDNGNEICADKYGFQVVRIWKKIVDLLICMIGQRQVQVNPLDPLSKMEHSKIDEELKEETSPLEEIVKETEKIIETAKVKESENSKEKEESAGPKKPSGKADDPKKVFEMEFTSQHARLFAMGAIGGLLFFLVYTNQEDKNQITFQEFTADFLRKNLVSRIRVVNNRVAIVELNDTGKSHHPNSKDFYFNIGNVESFERNLKAVQDEYKYPDALRVPVVYTSEGSTAKVLVNFVPTFLFLGAIYYMTKKAGMGGMGGPLGFGKSTAKKFNQEKDIKVKFKDVAGMNEAKDEVMEFVKFLQNPGKYEKLGAKIPRGAILSGPPGTGKTLIAKATAGEAGVPFYSVSGSEFVEMFVGVGASRVRDLFKTARENAPLIVFVDEIDAIGKQRSKGNASGANDERETTLNQLLVEMDGFDTSDHVVVLAGTNRADILDKALMRPGRFDRHIAIDNPELQGRKEIFDVHLQKIKLVADIDKDLSGRLAALTPGFSGADIANVCNEAALIAARFNAKLVALRHFELAIERVIGGIEKKSKLLSPEEKKIVAYHEAGHAVCGWFLRHAHPLLKVSIIPRGQGALGYAQYLPPDQYLMSAAQLYDRMIMTLGGRVSEEINFASVTSGAYDDFKKVTSIAQSMVMRFGMSPRVGMVNYADTQGQDTLTKPFSDETNGIIDEEIKRIVTDCHDKCKTLLTEKIDAVELVAQELLKKEFITREDMIRLLGRRPFPETNDAFDKYLDGKDAFKNEDKTE